MVSTAKTDQLWTRNFILLCIANLLMAVAFYFLISTLPVYLVEGMGENKTNTGLIIAFYTLAAIIIRPFSGAALDYFGRKWIFLAAWFIFALLFGLYAVSGTLVLLLIIRFLHGLSWGITTTSGSAVMADIIPRTRIGEGLGFFGLSMTVGMAMGPYLGIMIMGENRFLDVFFTGMVLALAGFVIATMVKYPKFQKHDSKIDIQSFIFKPSFPLSMVMMFAMISYGGLITFITVFSREKQLLSAGWFFAIFAAGLAISRIAGGRIYDRKGPSKVLIPAFFLLMIGFPVLSMASNNYLFLLSSMMLGMGFGIIFPVMQAMVNQLAMPYQRGAANSTFFTAIDIGIGFGSVSFGYLAQMFSLDAAYLAAAAPPAAACLFFLVFALKQFRKKTASIVYS